LMHKAVKAVESKLENKAVEDDRRALIEEVSIPGPSSGFIEE
jgi:hypothetical protein